jgi:molybdopterin-guanine dinucleotide biosynthesis protein A
LWQVELIDEVAEALAAGVRAMTSFAETQGSAVVDFPAVGGIDPFFNINTPADLEQAEALLAVGANPAPR